MLMFIRLWLFFLLALFCIPIQAAQVYIIRIRSEIGNGLRVYIKHGIEAAEAERSDVDGARVSERATAYGAVRKYSTCYGTHTEVLTARGERCTRDSCPGSAASPARPLRRDRRQLE